MVSQPAAEDRLIDRRSVLRTGAALAAAGPALLHGAHAKAQPRPSGASPMTIIDAQVHAYAANTPERPWHSEPNWPPHVTGDEMVAAMDRVGVDGAIYISPFSMYQYDASYAVEVQKAHPDKFALVKPVNPDDPAVADVIADWKKTPGTVGIRIIMTRESKRAPDDPGFDRILRAAVRNDFPVNILFWGNIDAGTALVDRHSRALHHRSSRNPAAEVATRAAATLGRPPQGAGTRQAQKRSDQGHRRLHAVPGAVPVSGHLGPTRSRVRRLGSRPLPVGRRLDARVCCRQLRAGRRALPKGCPPERH
jgi:hypothetical protein